MAQRITAPFAAALVLAVASAVPAVAAEPFPQQAAVAADTLGGVRGGMRIGDFDIDVGIAMQTNVDGVPMLTSLLQTSEEGVTAASTGLPAGGFDFVPADPVPGLDIAHTLTAIPAATVRNTLDRLSVDQLVTVDITVRNFRDRIDAARSQRIADVAARRAAFER